MDDKRIKDIIYGGLVVIAGLLWMGIGSYLGNLSGVNGAIGFFVFLLIALPGVGGVFMGIHRLQGFPFRSYFMVYWIGRLLGIIKKKR